MFLVQLKRARGPPCVIAFFGGKYLAGNDAQKEAFDYFDCRDWSIWTFVPLQVVSHKQITYLAAKLYLTAWVTSTQPRLTWPKDEIFAPPVVLVPHLAPLVLSTCNSFTLYYCGTLMADISGLFFSSIFTHIPYENG